MVTDPIADMLTIIRNGYRARLKSVDVPVSKVKTELAKVLEGEKYVDNYKVDGRTITLKLRYVQDDKSLAKLPALSIIDRVSKPGLRVYSNSKKLPRVMGGLGTVIVSTSQGLMSVKQAKKMGLGGELICKIY
jgi:small subunit ribosomal protein S8